MTTPGKKPRRKRSEADGEAAVLARIAAMPGPYRAMGGRLHAIITASAPSLAPRVWYGAVVCFFRGGPISAERYMTLGEGAMWPVAFALKEITAAEEARIGALVRKAAG